MLAELKRRVAEQVDAYSRGDPDALVEALTDIAHPQQFRAVITTFLDSRTLIQDIADQSYLHNNGFLKLTLASAPEYQVRLHVWDTREDGLPYFPESIHSHTADFASAILTGGYRHEVFKESPIGDEYFWYRFRGARGARSFSLAYVAPACLKRISDGYLPAGTIYSLTSDVLHRVIPRPNCLTASLVLKGPTASPEAEVYAEELLAPGDAIPVLPLPSNSFVKYANQLLTIPDLLHEFTG